MLFKRRKKSEPIEFDSEHEEPAIRCSICTGEQVAGFKNTENGHFREYMLIRSEAELKDFCSRCGTDEIKKIY